MQPDLILTPFGENATPGTIDPIPETRGPGDDPQQATWDEGFPLVTMTPLAAGGIPPKGQDFNGVLNAISEHTVFTGRGGQYKWSSAYVTASGGYDIGDVIQADDGLNSYVSLVNTNTANFNTTPASIGVSWALYAGRKTQDQATETLSGIAEIATQAEVTTGADDARIITPAKLRGAQATQAEAEAGTDNTKLMTPLRARQQRDKAGFAIDTGTANAYVCAFTPAIASRIEGQVLKFKVATTNTGASTLNDGVGVVALVGGAQTALQGGELVASGDAWVQWNTSVGGGSYILLFCTGAAEQVAPATKSQHAIQLAQMAAVVGGVRNAKMLVTAASATATLTADEVAVKTALGGPAWLLSNFSKTINLATTGAGGMDTGAAPANGYVAIYAIYSPATGVSALLAVNATSSAAPQVYGGANMPAGYTASALVGVWHTNGSGQFIRGVLRDRKVSFDIVSILSTSTQAAVLTSFTLAAAIPPNAVRIGGTMTAQSTVVSGLVSYIAADNLNIGMVFGGGNALTTVTPFQMDLITPQTAYYIFTSSAGSPGMAYYVSSYEF